MSLSKLLSLISSVRHNQYAMRRTEERIEYGDSKVIYKILARISSDVQWCFQMRRETNEELFSKTR